MPELSATALIPARLQSSRFPNKLLKNINGKPIVLHTYESIAATKLFKNVAVVTDNQAIHDIVNRIGGDVILDSTTYSCGTDRIAGVAHQFKTDLILNIQADEPFISAQVLKPLLNTLSDHTNIEFVSPMFKLVNREQIQDKNTVKVVVNSKGFAMYFSRCPIPMQVDITKSVKYWGHIGVYAFRKQALLDFLSLPKTSLEKTESIECLRWLENGRLLKMIEVTHAGIKIDTEEDLNKAKMYVKVKY